MYRKGDTVVHPEHGAAVITELSERDFLGETKKYFVLRLAYGDLTLMVPCDNTDSVGLREVINDEEVEEVFAGSKGRAGKRKRWTQGLMMEGQVEQTSSGPDSSTLPDVASDDTRPVNMNTVTFEVMNQAGLNSPMGLRVEGSVSAQVPEPTSGAAPLWGILYLAASACRRRSLAGT